MELIFLTVDDVIFVQNEILSNASVTDIGKLESAIKRAEQYHYYESVNDVIELTAIYIIGIAKAHAFPDGNKRTAFLSATYFLDMNGYAMKENSELPDIIEKSASGAVDWCRLVDLIRPYVISTKGSRNK
jgi:death on curing protein